MQHNYSESVDKLRIRIRAHQLYANFDVSEWLDSFCGKARRTAILDLGCGSGNHLRMYSRHLADGGRIVGMDIQEHVVSEAREAHQDLPAVEVLQGSMDEPLPLPDESFDLCVSSFAVYYAKDMRATMKEITRVLQPGGEVVLIGPTINNAREIYEYNERLTGTKMEPVTRVLTDRMRQEVLPLVKELFTEVRSEVLESFLTFPNADEFIAYFKSTMVYEETAKKLGVTDADLKAALPARQERTVSKEMLAVMAIRP